MNDLEKYFYHENHRLIHKWTHYFDIYNQYFERFRGMEINILEIGVAHGGSLQMWNKYFGSNVNIYGIDIDPQCLKFNSSNITVYACKQGDEAFLNLPIFDIIIDDGSHTMRDQISSFNNLFPNLKDGGVYLCEDTHTSYVKGFGAKWGFSFVNMTKKLIDLMYNWYNNKEPDYYSRSIKAIHYHPGIVVIEKDAMTKPQHLQIGYPTIKPTKINGLL